jgi:hypothetical protein
MKRGAGHGGLRCADGAHQRKSNYGGRAWLGSARSNPLRAGLRGGRGFRSVGSCVGSVESWFSPAVLVPVPINGAPLLLVSMALRVHPHREPAIVRDSGAFIVKLSDGNRFTAKGATVSLAGLHSIAFSIDRAHFAPSFRSRAASIAERTALRSSCPIRLRPAYVCS